MSTNVKSVIGNPIVKFFYKGSHSHPVRRTVVVTKTSEEKIQGYEIREGSVVRTTQVSRDGKVSHKTLPFKTYSKDSIAKIKELDKRRVMYTKTPTKHRSRSTLKHVCERLQPVTGTHVAKVLRDIDSAYEPMAFSKR